MRKQFSTPGPRAIYPDACTSRSLAACSVEAQLLFDRLIVQADDQGRFEGRTSVVKSLCVPLVDRLTVRAINRSLAELAEQRHVHLYRADGFDLIQLVTWWRWQSGMRRAYPSKWAAPEGWTDAVYGVGNDVPGTYDGWLSAAQRGTAPHNAAWCSTPPHPAAPRARAPAQPRAVAHAHASASESQEFDLFTEDIPSLVQSASAGVEA